MDSSAATLLAKLAALPAANAADRAFVALTCNAALGHAFCTNAEDCEEGRLAVEAIRVRLAAASSWANEALAGRAAWRIALFDLLLRAADGQSTLEATPRLLDALKDRSALTSDELDVFAGAEMLFGRLKAGASRLRSLLASTEAELLPYFEQGRNAFAASVVVESVSTLLRSSASKMALGVSSEVLGSRFNTADERFFAAEKNVFTLRTAATGIALLAVLSRRTAMDVDLSALDSALDKVATCLRQHEETVSARPSAAEAEVSAVFAEFFAKACWDTRALQPLQAVMSAPAFVASSASSALRNSWPYAGAASLAATAHFVCNMSAKPISVSTAMKIVLSEALCALCSRAAAIATVTLCVSAEVAEQVEALLLQLGLSRDIGVGPRRGAARTLKGDLVGLSRSVATALREETKSHEKYRLRPSAISRQKAALGVLATLDELAGIVGASRLGGYSRGRAEHRVLSQCLLASPALQESADFRDGDSFLFEKNGIYAGVDASGAGVFSGLLFPVARGSFREAAQEIFGESCGVRQRETGCLYAFLRATITTARRTLDLERFDRGAARKAAAVMLRLSELVCAASSAQLGIWNRVSSSLAPQLEHVAQGKRRRGALEARAAPDSLEVDDPLSRWRRARALVWVREPAAGAQ